MNYFAAPLMIGRGAFEEPDFPTPEKLIAHLDYLGIDRALVTVRLGNLASQAVALANGGVVAEKTDERALIWIDTQ